eukprot:UN28564
MNVLANIEPWFLSPIITTVIYLYFVKFGTARMAMRKEAHTRFVFEALFTYNLLQTFLNIWKFYQFYTCVSEELPFIWGNTKRYSPWLRKLVYVHYTNTYLDLIHTVFMVVRKRWDKMSFLHVYVRIMNMWVWFTVCKYCNFGDSYFGVMATSFAAVFQYSYFTLVLIGIHCPWKNCITFLQIFEFILGIIHALYVIWLGTMPVLFPTLQFLTMAQMLLLYTNFQYSYKPKSLPKKTAFSFDSTGWLYVYHF